MASPSATVEPTTEGTNDSVKTIDEINKVLIDLGKMKWNGSDNVVLLKATSKAVYQTELDFSVNKSNKVQINFAKKVWNALKPSHRNLLLPCDNPLLRMASNAKMNQLLNAALDMFNASSAIGDSQKAIDYLNICKQYAELKEKLANEGPFTDQVTEKELAKIAKFEAKRDEQTPRESFKPNSNAVTYVFLLGKLFYITKLYKDKDGWKTMKDILLFFGKQGLKSHANLATTINKYETIVGPISNENIKDYLEIIVGDENYVTANGPSEDNKYLDNNKLTMKRIVRIAHICTNVETPWGMLDKFDERNIDSLLEMYELEESISNPDMMSLAIVWYLAIGRSKLSTVMVDHWERSAANVLAQKLGKTGLSTFDPPDYAFPFDKNINETFNFQAQAFIDVEHTPVRESIVGEFDPSQILTVRQRSYLTPIQLAEYNRNHPDEVPGNL